MPEGLGSSPGSTVVALTEPQGSSHTASIRVAITADQQSRAYETETPIHIFHNTRRWGSWEVAAESSLKSFSCETEHG